ncbi:TRAP transporter substrate-binding protein DctP [Halobacteriovorax sp.]|uniref:TRAP transporter substrate-binding protein DctP n=1 Tax=Halobacteriovorax sp. TaxID=2020862 RepID=UPI0035620580
MKSFAFLFLIMTLFISCSNEKKFHWKLQTQANKSSVDYKELITLSENIKAMTRGNFVIDIYAAGEISNGGKIFESVRSGDVEIGNGWPNWWSAQNPAWAIMNAGPFDFMNLDASMIFFLAGEGMSYANQLAEKEGLIWRPAWWPGMEFGLISSMPIEGLADLKGKKVRIGPGLPSEVLADVAKSFSIPLVPNEIMPALKSGDIDAVEWTTASGILDLGLDDYAKNAIVPAIWQPSVLSDFIINQKSYNDLPEDYKAVLESAIKSFTLMTTLKAKKKDIEGLRQLKENGVQFNKWSDSDIKKWKSSSEKIYNQYRSRDSFSKELLDSKKKFKDEYNKYYELYKAYD